jgi:hypothetical protein
MRRRLIAIGSFLLATGLGMTSLTDSSASLAEAPDRASGVETQRLLVHRVQLASRAQREAELRAAAAAAAERARADALRAEAARVEAARAEAARAAEARRAAAGRPHRVSGPVDWKALVARYAWDVALAERVLWCESRGDPNAENAGANGLFQIIGGPFEPEANVALAYDMYRARGWTPWRSSRACWA